MVEYAAVHQNTLYVLFVFSMFQNFTQTFFQKITNELGEKVAEIDVEVEKSCCSSTKYTTCYTKSKYIKLRNFVYFFKRY